MSGWKKIILLIVLAALAIAAGAVVRVWQSGGSLTELVARQAAERMVTDPRERGVVETVLGFDKPQTYLVLFLNNTELRPGGGFIGAYAVVQIDKGKISIQQVAGTENLSGYLTTSTAPAPPSPLKKYLEVNNWYFRDSNWSPDFAVSSAEGLVLYQKQSGFKARELDGVIGFTPTVIEEILKISGPVVVNGQEYNSQNFTEKLEYEVEYGFAKRGVSFAERKSIMLNLGQALFAKLSNSLWKNWGSYWGLAQTALAEKQILMYSTSSTVQSLLQAKDWTGEMKKTNGDYLLWVDANLGALKTDVAIDRELSYQITPTSSGYLATVKMKYNHRGKFDWRTSRYRTYTRVFVPLGSKLVGATGAMKTDRDPSPGEIDSGVENGPSSSRLGRDFGMASYQWFGAFIAIQPGKTGELSFEFLLAPSVAESIKNNSYTLYWQKQLGIVAQPLTISAPQVNFHGTLRKDQLFKSSL